METVQHSIPLCVCVCVCVRVCVCVCRSTVMHVHLMCVIPEAQTLVLARIHSAEVSLCVLAELKGGSVCSTTNTQLDTYICQNNLDNLFFIRVTYAVHMLKSLPLSLLSSSVQVKRRCLCTTARLQSVPSARCCSGPESSRNTWRQRLSG